MFKILFLLILPLLVFSKYQITTYMPLEGYLIKKIAQNYVRSKVIVPTYSNKKLDLSHSEISRLANTKAYFHFGLDIEKEYISLLSKANPQLKVFDLSNGIDKISYNGKINHYVWMDPILLRKVAKNIFDAIVSLDKSNKGFYLNSYNALLDELDKIYLNTKVKLDKSEIYNIFIFDEYWTYYAKRFGINLYRKDKQIIKADEVTPLLKFVDKNEIKAVLVANDNTFSYAKSISGNADIVIKSNDIFDDFLFNNFINLTKELEK
ncbi:metal ABC transporter solute-binding protein, Zn/Mn family [Poseidonibacter lekithochrous]|uniref:metal ABC transporter solute-binding protein, Zn/Mn family n=1 Tax=Poseidonibacter lekithochrous TaxID=1904463 RepID=UPI0008FC96A2|nr:zinc ABC transporter substrate-binding protein [Poseidonibacter lekithochrous]QKJ22378.1 periplasmic substrate-binding protein [Poseidonibacter lekithochrous]